MCRYNRHEQKMPGKSMYQTKPIGHTKPMAHLQHATITLVTFLSLLLILNQPTNAQAAIWYSGEFSAEIIMTDPKNPNNIAHGTFYVGKDKFRAEGTHQGQHKILIVHPRNLKIWTLFPTKKTYYAGMGRTPTPPKPDRVHLPNEKKSPCQLDKNLICTKVGSESINGIQTDKWEITYQRKTASTNQPTHKITIWVDPVRHITIRRQPSGGPTLERMLITSEKVNGRQTEKWGFIQTFRGKSQHFSQWIDAKLRVPVLEKHNGKTVMELHNIKEQPQPASLFEIPKGYQEIQAPFRAMKQGHPGANDRLSAPPTPPALPEKMQYH